MVKGLDQLECEERIERFILRGLFAGDEIGCKIVVWAAIKSREAPVENCGQLGRVHWLALEAAG